ncbi:Fe(II)-2OG oxygenase family protein [Helicobacter vulpis]|uniref:TauD/TfdA family dioxygenase n=1 Tax=Helicobacter vulpis TaxID=2316076 RepID=UPI0013CDE2C4|nr:TauD/TfdA family dioxygenase [Helicobacter vulpis]
MIFSRVDNQNLPITGECCDDNIGKCPNSLSLLALRSQENVYTSTILLDDILSLLDASTIDVLQRPIFVVRCPGSFECDNIFVNNLPLLCELGGKFYSRFDYHNISTKDSRGVVALEKFKSVSLEEKLWKRFLLEPGQVIVFNNQRTLHTRNKFSPKLNGEDSVVIEIIWGF